MADRYGGIQNFGDYSRTRDARRALERQLAKGPVEVVPANEPTVPEPLKEWAKPARLLWITASTDEASAFFSSGDWMRLWITCNYYSDMLTGKTRYSAQAMEVVTSAMTELRLSDRAKRQDGIIVRRDEGSDADLEWLAGVLESTDESTDDE